MFDKTMNDYEYSMLDKTMDNYVNEFIHHEEVLQSEYLSYCNHCDGEPLSYDVWQHTDTSDRLHNNINDLPF